MPPHNTDPDTSSDCIDARGLKCPLPVLKLEKAAERLKSGEALTLLADDPLARVDVPVLCARLGYECETTEIDGVMRFSVKKT